MLFCCAGFWHQSVNGNGQRLSTWFLCQRPSMIGARVVWYKILKFLMMINECECFHCFKIPAHSTIQNISYRKASHKLFTAAHRLNLLVKNLASSQPNSSHRCDFIKSNQERSGLTCNSQNFWASAVSLPSFHRLQAQRENVLYTKTTTNLK